MGIPDVDTRISLHIQGTVAQPLTWCTKWMMPLFRERIAVNKSTTTNLSLTLIFHDSMPWRRGYKQKKVTENVECEIMQVVLEEAKEAYPEEAVHEVPSNNVEELESNVTRVCQWLEAWRENNKDRSNSADK